MMLALKTEDDRSIFSIAGSRVARYGLPVAANSAAGRRNPMSKRRNSAQITTAGVFFRLQLRVMAAVCGQASAWPGSFCPGIPTPCTAATQSRRKDRGSSSTAEGAPPMHALNPSAISPELQKAYCSRLLKTLLRYSSANELGRITATLESEVSKTLATRFVPGLNDASYDVYRSFWLKGGAK